MKIFSWMQNKLNGSNGKKKPNSLSSTHHVLHEPCKDEFSDWPQALLAIGTFGNSNLKENLDRTNSTAEDSSNSQDSLQEFTPEEAEKFQNELNLCFQKIVESNLAIEREECPNDQINKRLDSENSSLELERKENETYCDGSNSKSSSLIPSKGKNLCLDNSKSSIGKKSLSFLLKKMFVCGSGFQFSPSFKDALSTESRMEKILRAILHKKIYPQASSSTTFVKKYLDNRHTPKSDNEEDELNDVAEDGSKWVKTDSEYIVLEI